MADLSTLGPTVVYSVHNGQRNVRTLVSMAAMFMHLFKNIVVPALENSTV